MAEAKLVYVISDLHLGGRSSGFGIFDARRELCDFLDRRTAEAARSAVKVEIAINGDFIDFLNVEPWLPFKSDPFDAIHALDVIAEKDEPEVFESLRGFLRAGGSLTLLLGNHDVELCMPPVRTRLGELLDAQSRSFRFIYDGEAYRVGTDVLIEHGNRIDPFNWIDFDVLRRDRAWMSRSIRGRNEFKAPPGSNLVIDVIQPLMGRFPFVAKLKPEDRLVLPLLALLDMSQLRLLRKFSGLAAAAAREAFNGVDPHKSHNISSGTDLNEVDPDDLLLGSQPAPVREAIQEVFSTDQKSGVAVSADIDTRNEFRRLRSSGGFACSARRRALIMLVQSSARSELFEIQTPTEDSYERAALAMIPERDRTGPRIVAFGHTHIAKSIRFETGHVYNTGTWGTVLRVPRFVGDLNAQQTEQWIETFLDAPDTNCEPPPMRLPYLFLRIDESGKCLQHALRDFGVNPS